MLNIQMQTHSNAEYSNIEYSNVEYSNVEHSILTMPFYTGNLAYFTYAHCYSVYTCHWAPWCPGAILHQDISSTLTSQNNTLIITNIIFHISYHHNIISGPCRAGYPALQRQATPQHSAAEKHNNFELTRVHTLPERKISLQLTPSSWTYHNMEGRRHD